MALGIIRGNPPLEMLIWGVSLAIAAVPEDIRGYGPVKERSIARARGRLAELDNAAVQPVSVAAE